MTDEKYLKKLGEKVNALRKERKITQEEFSKNLKTHRSTIIRIEKGEVNSTINMLRKIAVELGISVDELVRLT